MACWASRYVIPPHPTEPHPNSSLRNQPIAGGVMNPRIREAVYGYVCTWRLVAVQARSLNYLSPVVWKGWSWIDMTLSRTHGTATENERRSCTELWPLCNGNYFNKQKKINKYKVHDDYQENICTCNSWILCCCIKCSCWRLSCSCWNRCCSSICFWASALANAWNTKETINIRYIE